MYVCIEYRDLFLCQVVVHVFFEDLEFGLVRCVYNFEYIRSLSLVST